METENEQVKTYFIKVTCKQSFLRSGFTRGLISQLSDHTCLQKYEGCSSDQVVLFAKLT